MVITIQNINYNIIYVSQKMQLSNFINICQIDISVNITRLLNIVKKTLSITIDHLFLIQTNTTIHASNCKLQ